MTHGDLIKRYLELRAIKERLEDEHKAKVAKVRGLMEEIEQRLATHFAESGTDNISVRGVGKAFRTTATSVKAADKPLFEHWLMEHDAWALADIRPAKTAVVQYLDDHGEPPPGVSVNRIHKVSVHKG